MATTNVNLWQLITVQASVRKMNQLNLRITYIDVGLVKQTYETYSLDEQNLWERVIYEAMRVNVLTRTTDSRDFDANR